MSSSSISVTYISEGRDDTGVPVTCSKCNEIFQTDSDYVVHYNEMHAKIDPEYVGCFKQIWIDAKLKETILHHPSSPTEQLLMLYAVY